jgi:hypothetical protein
LSVHPFLCGHRNNPNASQAYIFTHAFARCKQNPNAAYQNTLSTRKTRQNTKNTTRKKHEKTRESTKKHARKHNKKHARKHNENTRENTRKHAGKQVPNIFDMADTDQIFMAVRPICQAEGINPTKQNMYEKFLSRVQANLHLVLAFSPVGNAFRNRLRNFPSLVTCCTIDWFTEWPAEALRGVAQEAFADIDFPSDSIKDGIVQVCRDIHQGVEKASIK